MLNRFLGLPQNSADITGNSVDNNYNNFLAGGNLVRIDDKLYYNYERNELSYGLIEVSNNGSRRIFWEGRKWFGAATLTHRIHLYNGQLVMALDDEIKCYSTDKFEVCEPLNSIPEISLCFQEGDQGLLYESAVEPGQNGSLCVYDGHFTKVIAGPNIEGFYADGDDIYYYAAVKSGTSGEFRKYDADGETDESVYELNGYGSVFSFVIEDDYLIFGASNSIGYSIYKINLNRTDKVIDVVCAGNEDVSDYLFDIRSWNVYNGTIYVASHSGLTAFDVTSGESLQLYNRYVEECYIVDDMWVYFVDAKACLWRVTQDGSTIEQVFGH